MNIAMTGCPVAAAEELRPLTAYEIDFVSGGGGSGSITLPALPNITTVVNIGPIGVLTQVALNIGSGKAFNIGSLGQFNFLGIL